MVNDIKEDIQKIYSMIPNVSCSHCHKCCDNIIWFEPENILIRDFLKNNIFKTIFLKNLEINKKKCPFLGISGCLIYPVRPIVCRFQGNIKELKCDLSKNNKLINLKKLNKIKKEFQKILVKTNGFYHFYSSRDVDLEYFYGNGSGK